MIAERLKRIQLGAALLLFIALLWGFQDMLLNHAPNVFRAKEEDMSFAWFVPLYSLYVLWKERGETIAACKAGSPSLWGILLAVPCLALGFFGARGLQVRFEILAFIGLLIAIPWTVYGAHAAKRFVFPALFLCFCIPLATFLDIVTVHLRLFATSVAYSLMHGFGVDIVRRGTMLAARDGSFQIDVADPCGGLRSLFAIMALTAGYAYFVQKTWLRRGILFLCSIPLAIFGNVVRIFSICLVAHLTTGEFATGYYHDFSWLPVYAVPLLMIPLCSQLIARVGAGRKGLRPLPGGGAGRKGRGAEGTRALAGGFAVAFGNLPFEAKLLRRISPPTRAASASGKYGLKLATLILAALIFIPMLLWQAYTPRPKLMSAPKVEAPVLAGFTSTEIAVSEQEIDVLPKDTQFVKRLYTSDLGEQFAVSWVIGGSSKSSIHRPELCLPAQGFQMMSPHNIEVDGLSWREIYLATHGEIARRFSYTFYNQAGYQTSSHVARIWRDIWDRSILNRIDRWVMITVYGDCQNEARWQEFLSKLMKEAAQ